MTPPAPYMPQQFSAAIDRLTRLGCRTIRFRREGLRVGASCWWQRGRTAVALVTPAEYDHPLAAAVALADQARAQQRRRR